MSFSSEKTPSVTPPLKRAIHGEAIITTDAAGLFRYMYADGSHDPLSTVDFRNPTRLAFVIEGNILTMQNYSSETVEAIRLKLIVKDMARLPEHPNEAEANLRHLGHLGMASEVAA